MPHSSALRPGAATTAASSGGRVPILLVDDREANLLALEAVLRSPDYDIASADSGEAALGLVAEADFAVALLDVQMPTMDGFETATKMKELVARRGRQLPIVFVTGIDGNRARVLHAYATAGAVDFIQKPFEAEVIRAKVSVFVDLFRARERVTTEKMEARRRLKALTEASRGLSPVRTRQEIAAVVVEQGVRAAQADICTLYALEEAGGTLALIGERGAAPEVIERIRRITQDENPSTFAALRDGTSTWAEGDDDYVRLFPRLAGITAQGKRARAFWSLPLMVEGRPVGLLGMGFHEPRTFSEEERAFVEAFAQQCAEALLRVSRLEREEAARAGEERDRARSAFLAQAGEALVSSLDYSSTLATVAHLAVHELADWCTIDLLEPGAEAPRAVTVAHRDPSKVDFVRELGARYPPDPHAPTGAPQVIRTGKSELYVEIPAALLEAGARDAEHLRIIRELRLESAMVVPLRSRGRTLGAITFIYADTGRRYDESDLAFAEEFARRAAMAIENASALKEAEDARAHERALRAETEASERMFHSLVDNLPELAWHALPDGHIDFYNRRWYEYTGTTFEQMQGWGWKSVHQPDMLEAVEERWKHSIETGEPFEMEFPLRRADGTYRWFLTRVEPLRDAGGRVVRWFGTNTDIDDRRRDAEFQERFLAILGHDLRNPLAAIDMGVALLQRRLTGERDAKLLARMTSSSRRMSRMIEQILDLTRSRLGGGIEIKPAPVDLADVLAQVTEELTVAHPTRSIVLECGAPIEGGWDKDRLEQVFSNLIGNAVQYGLPTAPVTVEARDDGGRVVVRVHNDGPPIPDEVRSRLFDPFRRGARDSRSTHAAGLGLGLFISREIVVAHGGTLEVHSTSTDGTTFLVALPRARGTRADSLAH